LGRFDYVLANPPFNVDDVSLEAVKADRRFNTYGIPQNKTKVKKSEQGKETVPNANYLWINLFATSLKEPEGDYPGGRAGLVMANSASDARHSEAEIRQTLIEQNLIDVMVTLPSNLYYTVTLPATLWFFDKGKTDDRILFIDARNIFTTIDRAHREFSEEQIQNIAMISRLHRGRRDEFVALVDRYFGLGMDRLLADKAAAIVQAETILAGLSERSGREAVVGLIELWEDLAPLDVAFEEYRDRLSGLSVEAANGLQHEFRSRFDGFFDRLHGALKAVERAMRAQEKAIAGSGKRGGMKGEKESLERLRATVRDAEVWFGHGGWLQERFPAARYEDVVGLCRLADLEEVKEQDFSLNPGRYVGVVIEEDGKTEEEFIEELMNLRESLKKSSSTAKALEKIINDNISILVNDE
jgi:type I restriction enzyme M protein